MGSYRRGSARRSPLGATLAAIVVLGAGLLVSAGRAGAHSFLVNTDPAQGARLGDAPSSIALQFSAPVDAAGASVSVSVLPATRPLIVNVERLSGGLVLRVTLAQHPQGIYLVHWHVVADDGHDSDGEFAFAVGAVGGQLPAPSRRAAGASPVAVGASWLFFAGLASALGALATGLAVDPTVTNRAPALRAGLLVAVGGAAATLVRALGQPNGAGLTRDGWASVAAVSLLCVAVLAATWQHRRLPVLIIVVGAAVAWSARGHAATMGGPVGFAVDAVHLAVGATWAGSLAIFVWQLRRRRDSTPLMAFGRRYARLALPLVVVLAVAGAVSALRLVPTWRDLWADRYGQLIIAKTVLFAAALSLAIVARRRGLGGRETILRRAASIEVSAVALVLAVTAVLVNVAPPAPAQAATDLLGPPPLTGPVERDAGLAGILTVAVAAGDGQLQIEVFAPGGAVPGTKIDLEASFPDGRQASLFPRPCGPGCFTQPLTLPPGATELAVNASAPGWQGGTYRTALSAPPPPEEPQLLSALVAQMRAAGTFELTETVTSGPGSTVTPNTFQISASQFLAGEPYAAGTASDVEALATGGPGFHLFIAGDRIWVTIWLDSQGRIARERVIDVGHDVERSFTYPGR